MVWLPLPIVIAGVLVALAAKVMFVLPPPRNFLSYRIDVFGVGTRKQERKSKQ